MTTNSPVAAALALVRFAQRSDVSAPTAVAIATVGLDREQLVSVLRLLHPFFAELYAIKQMSKRALDARDEATFTELMAQIGDLDAKDPSAYDSDPIGEIWRTGPDDGEADR